MAILRAVIELVASKRERGTNVVGHVGRPRADWPPGQLGDFVTVMSLIL